IARRHGTSVEALVTLNGFSSTSIYVGQQLLIASTKTPLAPTTALPTATATPTGIGTPIAYPTGVAATPTVTLTPTPSTSPTSTPSVAPTATPTLNPLTPTPTRGICDASYPDFCLTPGIA